MADLEFMMWQIRHDPKLWPLHSPLEGAAALYPETVPILGALFAPPAELSITHKSFVKLCYTHRLTAAPMEHLHSYRITP